MLTKLFILWIGIAVGFAGAFVGYRRREKEKDDKIAHLKEEANNLSARCENLYERIDTAHRQADLSKQCIDDYSSMIAVYKAANEKELGVITYKGERFMPESIDFRDDMAISHPRLEVTYIGLPKMKTEVAENA